MRELYACENLQQHTHTPRERERESGEEEERKRGGGKRRKKQQQNKKEGAGNSAEQQPLLSFLLDEHGFSGGTQLKNRKAFTDARILRTLK